MTKLSDIREDIKEVEEVASEIRHGNLSKSEKQNLIKELKKPLMKLKKKEREEVRIFAEDIHYGQVPTALLIDPKVLLQAKGLYAVLHSFSMPKELMAVPRTYVTLGTLSKATGKSKRWIMELMKHLANAGWVRIENRGYRRSNWYYLCGKKRRVKKE